MTMTVYVDGWDNHTSEVKYYMDELYPNLDHEDFRNDPVVKLEESTGRFYEFRSESSYPSLSVSNASMSMILDFVGTKNVILEDDGIGNVLPEKVSGFLGNVMKSRNNMHNSGLDKNTVFISEGNWSTMNVSRDRMASYLDQLMNILVFANKNGVGVYWA